MLVYTYRWYMICWKSNETDLLKRDVAIPVHQNCLAWSVEHCQHKVSTCSWSTCPSKLFRCTLDRIAWRFHIEIKWGKVFRTFIKVCFLFNTQELSTNTKLTLQKVLIISVMTYISPIHVFAADTHLLKLLHLQNKAVRSIGSFHGARHPMWYDFVTKWCAWYTNELWNRKREHLFLNDVRVGVVEHN